VIRESGEKIKEDQVYEPPCHLVQDLHTSGFIYSLIVIRKEPHNMAHKRTGYCA
jgi:hypothetical protein